MFHDEERCKFRNKIQVEVDRWPQECAHLFIDRHNFRNVLWIVVSCEGRERTLNELRRFGTSSKHCSSIWKEQNVCMPVETASQCFQENALQII